MEYALSKNIDEFQNNLKFIITQTGGFAGLGNLFLVTPDRRVYKSTSHSACNLGNIENESVSGEYLGTLTVDITNIYIGKAERIPTECVMMDAIETTVYCTSKVPNCDICYSTGGTSYEPKEDVEKYRQMVEEIYEMYDAL